MDLMEKVIIIGKPLYLNWEEMQRYLMFALIMMGTYRHHFFQIMLILLDGETS